MLGMGDRHERAGRLDGGVEQVVLDAHVDVELHHQVVDPLLAFGRPCRRTGDLLAQGLQDVVVLDEHLVSSHSPAPVAA